MFGLIEADIRYNSQKILPKILLISGILISGEINRKRNNKMHIPTPVIIMISVWIVCLIFIGLCVFQIHNRDYMENITKYDRNKMCLHINQFKNHQDIYLVPVEKWKEHPIDWWEKHYPKEYYVGYYSFSLFYVGQKSPR